MLSTNMIQSTDFFMLLGQIMLIVGVAGTFIHIARWIGKRHVSKEFTYFVVDIAVTVALVAFVVILFYQQNVQLLELETGANVQQALIKKDINVTKHIEGENRLLNLKQIATQNLTITNQQLIRHNQQALHEILGDLHIHLTNQSLNASQSAVFR